MQINLQLKIRTVKSLLILVLILLTVSCKNAEDESKKFVGKWHDTEYIIPTKGFIEIKSDSTFFYRIAGCGWRSISKGSWILYHDTIELISGKIDTCYYTFPFVKCVEVDELVKYGKTISNCSPEDGIDFREFTNERFYLRNDTLIYSNSKNLKCLDSSKIKFAKTRKIKKGFK